MVYRRLGCCSTGPATFGQDEAGSSEALLPVVNTIAPVGSAAPYPWAHLFMVSVAAGLTLHFLTRRKG